MASLTGGFAPIAGAGAAKDKGAKKNDLTSGLISLSGNGPSTRAKSDDLDFADFDVDDLLLDDTGGSSKAKSKSKSKSPSSSPKKKKSSGSGSSSKKKKDKKKSSASALDFLDEEEGDKDDWDKPDDDAVPKKASKAFDIDELMSSKKKNARLDDEFARMLGIEDDFVERSATVSSAVNEEGDISEYGDSPVKQFGYAPSVRTEVAPQPSSKAEDSTPLQVGERPDENTGDAESRGLDASFFQDEPTKQSGRSGGGDDDFLSFLSSTSSSDRRGARGGGRRGGSSTAVGDDEKSSKSLFADPFGKSDTGGRRGGGLDDLFSSSRAAAKPSKPDLQENEAQQPAKEPSSKSTFASLFGGDKKSNVKNEPDDSTGKPVPRSLSSTTGTAKISTNAGDDLLAELFPTEAPRVVAKKSTPPAKDENVQQDDLLAELFPLESKTLSHLQIPQPTRSLSPPPPDEVRANEPKPTSPSPPSSARSTESKQSELSKSSRAGIVDVTSARDDLLKDILPDSPPRSRRPVIRGAESSDSSSTERQGKPALSTSPATTTGSSGAPTPSDASLASSAPLQQTPPRSPGPATASDLSPPKRSPSPTKLTSDPPESPLPSLGKTKTLTLGTPSKVREVEFEQSKDDLLEEILSSAPPSPQLRSSEATAKASTSPRSRRSSYSLSFDQEAAMPIATSEVLEPPPMVNGPHGRRSSRSPEKKEAPNGSLWAAPGPTTATITQTVFLRDEQAEDELKKVHAAEIAALESRHAEEVARITSESQQLQAQLQHEQGANAVLTAQCESHKAQLRQLQDDFAEARGSIVRLTGELQSLQTKHTLQQTQCELFDREKTSLVRQISVAEEQQRALVAQLADEKLAHQKTQLAFAEFKRETEQASQLRTEKERAQMDRLYHQLQHSLAQLTVLQEQGGEEAVAKRELEAASRLRMISSLESTSRGYAQQTQDECHRLTSLLSSLEATLRAYRQEHLEEKERLRQEQMRLNVLAQHFQAQTSVLNEKSDANAQLLAQQLGASLQDTRAAEARLALRRQQLADDEQKLYSERALFASHREAWLEQRQREAAELEAQHTTIQREWRALQRERDDLEDVIASHEDAFRALQQQQLSLEAEKDRVATGALHVAEMAQKFEQLTKQLVEKEHAMQQQRVQMEDLQRQWTTREQSVASERRKLDERESRLHTQLKQMESARRKMNDERREQLQHLQLQHRQRSEFKCSDPKNATRPSPFVTDSADSSATVGGVRAHVTLGSHNGCGLRSTSSPMPSTMQFTQHTASLCPPLQFASLSPAYDASKTSQLPQCATVPQDPSGFSPSFRQLVEDNWSKQSRHTDAALHKERMAIHCLGLDTSTKSTVKRDTSDGFISKNQRSQPSSASTTAPGISTTKATIPLATAAPTTAGMPNVGSRMPPPPQASIASSSFSSTSSVSAARVMSVHL